MKNNFSVGLLFLICIFFGGCASLSLEGPISGKKYESYYDQGLIEEKIMYKRRKPIDKYLRENPETPENIKNAMLAFKTELGMTKEQIIAVVSKPSEVIVDDKNLKETLVYSGTNDFGIKVMKDVYFYFKEGVLVAWENESHIYVREHPGLSSGIKDAIIGNEVALGMNKDQVVFVLGNPKDINKTVGTWGVHEQWVYNYQYVYFENGEVTSWQE